MTHFVRTYKREVRFYFLRIQALNPGMRKTQILRHALNIARLDVYTRPLVS